MSNIQITVLLGLTLMTVVACEKHVAAPAPEQQPNTTAVAPAEQAAPSAYQTAVQPALMAYKIPADAVDGGHCSLDAINGASPSAAIVTSGSDVLFAGWAGDSNNQPIPSGSQFVLKGQSGSYSIQFTTGGDRPDVAEALNGVGLKSSGFNFMANMAGVPIGKYEALIVFGVEKPEVCKLNVFVTVK